MNDYKAHAYALSVLGALQRYLLENYIATETPPRSQLICEEVFFGDREVPQDALIAMLERLQRMEADERDELREFEMQRRPQKKRLLPANEEPSEEPKEDERKQRSDPAPAE